MTHREMARLATLVQNGAPLPELPEGHGLIIGVTGPPGAGKSTLVDAVTSELRKRGRTVAIVAVDPSSRVTRGAILGDRVRMQRHHADNGVFIRSMATRGAIGGLAGATAEMARLFRSAEFDFVVIETVGVGQDEIEVADLADVTVLVLAPGFGDDVQAIKAGIMEIADVFVINKADRPGAAQTRREVQVEAKSAPVFQTVATEGAGVRELVDDLERRVRRAAREATEGLPDRSPWRIDHLGIAARSVDEALAFYSRLSVPVLHRETVEREKVRVAMLPAGAEARIELLEPLDETSAIARFLEKRGPGIHHIAMKVPDLAATARSLAAAGVKLVGTPQRGAGGHLYVFVHPSSTGGVLWELIQE